MCGEKKKGGCREKSRLGSPPHVRGKDNSSLFIYLLLRITPACAGKSWEDVYSFVSAVDHPRMCGEKGIANRYRQSGMGSPPHVRGKGYREQVQAIWDGITPACAGKRDTGGHSVDDGQDHPRMCGEKALASGTMIIW